MKSLWATIEGLRMHARVWERDDLKGAPAIVLVPGLGLSSRYIIPTADLLAKEMRVFAPELPGFGLSEKPRRPMNVQQLSRFLSLWVAEVGLSGAMFVGNSFGCQVISQLAFDQPGLINRMIMVAPTVDPSARQAWRQLLRLAGTALREPLGLFTIATADYLKARPWKVWSTFRFALNDPIEERLQRISVPTLVVRGQRDWLVPEPWALEAAELLPAGSFMTIPHAAHGVYYSSPHELAEIIYVFMSLESIQ